MADTAISPGVYSKIIDLSSYLSSTPGTIGFVPIITEKGEDNVLTRLTGTTDYITRFGEPNIKTFGKYYGQGPYIALEHLSVSSDFYTIRALPDDATYAHAFVAFTEIYPTASNVDSSTDSAADVDESSAPATATDNDSADKKIGLTSFSCTKKSADGIKFLSMNCTKNLDAMFTGVQTAQVSALTNGSVYHDDPDGKDINQSVLFYVRAVGRGDYYNKFSFLLRADSNPANFGIYTFELYEDQDGSPVLVENYNVTFDPLSTDNDGESNFIEDVVNKYSTNIRISVNTAALPRYNKFIEKFYKNDPTIADTRPDFVFGNGFPELDSNGKSLIPEYSESESCIMIGANKIIPTSNGEYSSGSTYLGSFYSGEYDLGTKAEAIYDAYFQKAIAAKLMAEANAAYVAAIEMSEDEVVTVSVDGTDTEINRDQAIDRAIIMLQSAQEITDAAQDQFDSATSMSLMSLEDSDDTTFGVQTYYMEQGSLGGLVTIRNGVKTVQPSVANQILCQAYNGLLKKPVNVKKVDESTGTVLYKTQYAQEVLDTDWIYFSIVYDGGYKPNVKEVAKELVETRRDCVLISDCGDNSDIDDVELYTGVVKGGQSYSWNSYLAARYEPYFKKYDQYLGCDNWFSPVVAMAKAIPMSDSLYDIWYAVAGFKRGSVSDILELRWSPNKSERDRLYLAQVNPIVQFPEGMTIWGQLTTQKQSSALSDLNCVRTVLYIKRAIEKYLDDYIFDFNDTTEHDEIKKNIFDFLSTVQSARGIKAFSVNVGCTDYEFKTKTAHVNVEITPMKVMEKIMLNLYVK